MKKEGKLKWLSSKEARKFLKITDCELAHLRHEGKLTFEKRGNAFLYYAETLNFFAKKAKDHYK